MKLNRLVAVLGLTTAFGAFAQTVAVPATDHAVHRPVSAASDATTTDGEVRRIDKAQGKVTLRHGPIASLDMPAMTMVFKVADTKMLDTLKEGDKVRFAADRVNGAITVTAIEAAK